MSKPTFSAVILAAGAGNRYGKKKQYELLRGKEIWRWSYDAFKGLVDEIVVVGVDLPGGKTRRESIYIGLKQIKGQYVIIHDAVRPMITEEQIEEVKKVLLAGHKSVSFYFPSTDTIYHDRMGYLERSELRRVQVPQAFETATLKKAHEESKQYDATDDCRLVEEVFDIKPHFIMGGVNLHKLTYPGDMAILEVLCQEKILS